MPDGGGDSGFKDIVRGDRRADHGTEDDVRGIPPMCTIG